MIIGSFEFKPRIIGKIRKLAFLFFFASFGSFLVSFPLIFSSPFFQWPVLNQARATRSLDRFYYRKRSFNCLFGFDSAEFYGDYRVLEKYSGKGNKPRNYILMRANGHKSPVNECSGEKSRLRRTRSTGEFVTRVTSKIIR